MKTIGIIGGMGSEATLDLFHKIIKQTHVTKDQDHVHIIIDNHARIPDRSHYILTGEHNPSEYILEAAKRLESLKVDYIAIPCNTAHFFYEAIKEKISTPLIHMIKETYHYILKNNLKKVLLLATQGTYASNLYQNCFKNSELLEPNEILKGKIHKLIYDYKKYGKVNSHEVEEIQIQLSALNVDAVILGCTELPLIFKGPRFIDPTAILARACIKKAGHRIKK
ncbi:MAG: aspartate/glutamate racemase family protein [Clostridia bacterium]|nr:aspartate/glutamate racemase family protein [Clostridia bacterium]